MKGDCWMKRIAIISFNHGESSLCLAKNIAKEHLLVDYYYINNPITKGRVPGFEYYQAKIHWGLQRLDAMKYQRLHNTWMVLRFDSF
jgi:hypothetical protein